MKRDASTAIAAANEFLSAIWRRDHDEIASWLDPADLTEFQKTTILGLVAGFLRRDLARESGAQIGCVPPAQVADALARGRYDGQRVNSFTGQPSLASLGALPPAAFFASALEANLVGRPPARPPSGTQPFSVLGAVPEDAGPVHILYRQALPSDVPIDREEAVQRLELLCVEGAWRVRLDRRLRFLATPQSSERGG